VTKIPAFSNAKRFLKPDNGLPLFCPTPGYLAKPLGEAGFVTIYARGVSFQAGSGKASHGFPVRTCDKTGA
jgi:hypothetical protein